MSADLGYGKVITSGLTFSYDVTDTTNCYIGEPTTNILPDAINNGRFTIYNVWETYSVNQYNSGNFFSIGTILDITDNIVTTDGSHNLKSFDCITPDISGGGVYIDIIYVVKCITDTQFSLHEYISDQTGSMGYINPITNFYKVHDAFALDIRISISFSSFPTMWKEPSHTPNADLIKEVVNNGGVVKNTSCMRLHVFRGDNIAGGMAYGVNTPVISGQTITLSFYYKSSSIKAVGKILTLNTYFYGGVAPEYNITFGELGVWQRAVFTWTVSNTCDFIQYFFPEPSIDKYDIDLSDIQVEVKSHVTKFTTGTRSVTNSLLPLYSKIYNLDSIPITFTKPNYATSTVDVISDNITLKRGNSQSIYNSNVESSWSSTSPTYTEWNAEGWGDLTNLSSRTYDTLYNVLYNQIGSFIIDTELIMHDTQDDVYWKFIFTSWTQSGGGGGFSYNRTFIPSYSNNHIANQTIDLSNISFDSNSNLLFDGTNNRLNTNNITKINFYNGFTWCAMIYCKGSVSYWNCIMGNVNIFLCVKEGNTISFYNDQYGTIDSDTISLNKWYYVVGTIQYNDGNNNEMKLYLNGVLVASTLFDGVQTDYHRHVMIGDMGYNAVNSPFYGYIDQVSMYNRVLTQYEISQNTNHYKRKYDL